MLRADLHTIRLAIHIVAAAVWVGGQLTLVGLLPVVRTLGDDAPRAIARRFNLLAWVAYAVLMASGVWNVFEVQMADRPTEYHITLGVKMLAVGLSGIGAGIHAIGRSKAAYAVGGSIGLLAGLASIVFGVMLRG
jgi:putative copper export protein